MALVIKYSYKTAAECHLVDFSYSLCRFVYGFFYFVGAI